jgi:chemotaxis protein MotB
VISEQQLLEGEKLQHRKSRVHEEEHAHPMVHDESNWLVSYADMMTLLFGFFVLMYTFSKIDEEKFEVVKKDVVKYFGGTLKEANGAWTLKKTVDEKLNAILLNGGVKEQLFDMQVQEDSLKIVFQSKLLFAPGSVELSAEAAKVIDTVARELKKYPLQSIEVQGHTDIDAIQSAYFPSNWELSSARSSRIVRRLGENAIADDKLVAVGYGSSRPAFPHKNSAGDVIEENKDKNRRVELNVKLKPQAAYSTADLEKMGFLPQQSEAAKAEMEKQKKDQDAFKARYEESQRRLEEVNSKLKQAQEREKTLKEMERMAKKAEDIEKKIKAIEDKTKQTTERSSASEKDPTKEATPYAK